jgi:hypothetical protein
MKGCANRRETRSKEKGKSKEILILPIIMELIKGENVFLGAGFP